MAKNSKILMFWNPNYDTVDNLNPWWPGADYVDIVSMDNYPPPGTSFETAYGDFYHGFAELSLAGSHNSQLKSRWRAVSVMAVQT